MILDEEIKRFNNNAEYERTHGNLQGCLDFRQLVEFLKELKQLREQTRWIPCSERLPKENEHIGNVCKYYLIQDEYGDMHVAHLSNVGWIPMDSLKAIGAEVIAWMPLPSSYQGESPTDSDKE